MRGAQLLALDGEGAEMLFKTGAPGEIDGITGLLDRLLCARAAATHHAHVTPMRLR
jgi:hypothetical protein